MSSRLGVAIVIIGRNEGERLRRCIESVVEDTSLTVYVDSGSSDGSVPMARSRGVHTVELDMSIPFTAARARNAGFSFVTASMPELKYVQFVDGDCEVERGWLSLGREFLDANEDVAVVCGRRRERYPKRSIYNLLCDIEWNVPSGPALACGGDAMIRVGPLRAVRGYRDDLIAGEEPELCVRLRAAGWKIHVLDARMTLHDADMTRFRQWWRRSVRSGYAYAEGAELHGKRPEQHCVRQLQRAIGWAAVLPISTLLGLFLVGPLAAALLLVYLMQFIRLFRAATGDLRTRAVRSAFLLIGKFAELQGAMKYWYLRTVGRSGTLIEYK